MTAPDTLPPELAELGELLREDPPQPDPTWARRLDQRAAAGFPRPPRRSLWARVPRGALLPALGLVATAAIVAVVVVVPPAADNGSSGGGGSPASSGQVGRGGSPASSGEAGGGASATPMSAQSESSSDQAAPVVGKARSFAPPNPGGGSPGTDSRTKRLQERSASLTLAARPREIETVADGIVRVADSAGGFVASSNVSDSGGDFSLRVPTDRLQRALADLSRLAHVRGRSQATQDITAEAVSARGRLRELLKEREGLLRALGKATTINETDAIKQRLRSVNASIAVARQALRRVNNRAQFANVAVTLVADRSAGAAGSGDDRWTPADAVRDAGRVLEVAAGVALIALAILVPLGVLVGLGALAGKAATRRRRARALDAV